MIARPGPGAIGVVATGAAMDGREARQAVLRPFRRRQERPAVLADGPLTLAWRNRLASVYTSDEDLCLLEGTLYDLERLQKAAGHHGPPEMLLAAAYRRLGLQVFNLLRGDFWVVLWDRKLQRGVIACDQLGERSPYWFQAGDRVFFASELPDLLGALPGRPDPDPVAMAHWLALTVAPEGRSLFAGIRRLEAGHCIRVGGDTVGPERYWSPRFETPARLDTEELASRLRQALEVSVERRLQDVTSVGVLLSGGLDSSAVAALAASPRRGAHLHVDAYSATFPDWPTVDETSLIDRTTRHLDLASTRIIVKGGSVMSGALSYLSAWRVPPTSPNLFFWIPLLQRAAADGIQVMLDGEGGDEVFGFSPYLLADLVRHGQFRAAVAMAQRIPGSANPAAASRIWRLLRRFGLKGAMPAAAHRAARRLRGPEHHAASWMRPATARIWIESEAGFDWKTTPGPRWWAHLVDTVVLGVGPALVYEQARRRAEMAGVRARHPLVDVDVIELMLRMPPDVAFDPRFSRPLLRQSLKGLLPDEVRLRPSKSNFDAIFHASLAGADLPVVRQLLGRKDARVGEYVDLASIRGQLLDPGPPEGRSARQGWAIAIWRLLMAECWLQTQEDSAFPERMEAAGEMTQNELVTVDRPGLS